VQGEDKSAKRLVQMTIKRSSTAAPAISQQQAEKLIRQYIVNSLSPVSHVEHPSFVELLHGFAPHINLPSRWTLTRRIEDVQAVFISNIQKELNNGSFICITADAWTGFKNRRSFMGVTAHTLTGEFKRKSFALACRFFPGTHSFDRIAAMLSNILKQYNVPLEKVICCVTDNGSNFVKAFREFHMEVEAAESDEEACEDDDDITEIDMEAVIQPQAEAADQCEPDADELIEDIVLPPHQRCASHTLNLVGCSSPTAAAKANGKYRSLLHSTNGKLSAVWNKVNSPKSNEIIRGTLGCQLILPVPTRWNSYYDARRSLLLHGQEKVNQLCVSLALPQLKDVEYSFVKEEIHVLTPLAQGLDRLQGQWNPESYMGFLFPTLIQLRHAYAEMKDSQQLKYCAPLASAVAESINERFHDYFTFAESTEAAALATISHPAFKLRWVEGREGDVADQLKNLFIRTVRQLASSASGCASGAAEASLHVDEALDSKTLDFFTFMENTSSETGNAQSQAELQALQYLDDGDRTLQCLVKFPAVREVFRKYNVALPSSAAVERLFSVAGVIGTAKRNRLRPELFEKLLLQQVNAHACNSE